MNIKLISNCYWCLLWVILTISWFVVVYACLVWRPAWVIIAWGCLTFPDSCGDATTVCQVFLSFFNYWCLHYVKLAEYLAIMQVKIFLHCWNYTRETLPSIFTYIHILWVELMMNVMGWKYYLITYLTHWSVTLPRLINLALYSVT